MCFSKILKYIPDSGPSRFPLGVSVCTQWQVKTQRLPQNLQSSEKSQHFKEKTQYVMNTLYMVNLKNKTLRLISFVGPRV